jgi:LAO/AO transport system kinase
MSGDVAALAAAVLAGERRSIAKAITLVESERALDRPNAERLLTELQGAHGRAFRLGVTGAPGVGKSTLLDTLGLHAIEQGRRVGVLAIDPSSVKTGGSLLGDRTRMARLSASPAAFVRPSPSSGVPGGVTKRAREVLLVLESAGYDLLVVETVGVGQGELAVTDCVDLLLVLWMVGAGDDVQGMKRGILEHADLVAFTKADGANLLPARAASERLSALLTAVRRDPPGVLAVSALAGADQQPLWDAIAARRAVLESSGELERRRAAQRRTWLRAALDDALSERFALRADLVEERARLEAAVDRGELLAPIAARRLIERL